MLTILAGSVPGHAAAPLSARLAPLGFLVGHWVSDSGHAEAGRTTRGSSAIEPAAGGAALLRRDHTELLGRHGEVAQRFEQIMLIYPEGDHLRGDYFDGTHAIHYTQADVTAGQSVRFSTADAPGAPAFRLTYTRQAGGGLQIVFAMRPPGQSAFGTVAEGTVHPAP